ncbi:MAG: hypothetical protein AAF902_02100 [Chloroflexota bacterium]
MKDSIEIKIPDESFLMSKDQFIELMAGREAVLKNIEALKTQIAHETQIASAINGRLIIHAEQLYREAADEES